MAGWLYGATLAALTTVSAAPAMAQDAWYVQGDFTPSTRVAVVIANDLDEDRPGVPVVIRRDQVPMLADIQELTVTLVDPMGEPRPEPSPQLLARQGPHERRGETNGRALDYQFDDLDRDGVWDELFFVVDMKASERKTLHLYRGFQQRLERPPHPCGDRQLHAPYRALLGKRECRLETVVSGRHRSLRQAQARSDVQPPLHGQPGRLRRQR